MKILLNNIITPLPSDYMTVEELVTWRKIKPQGTAVAINDNIVKKENWHSTRLSDLDRVTIISAAFGG